MLTLKDMPSENVMIPPIHSVIEGLWWKTGKVIDLVVKNYTSWSHRSWEPGLRNTDYNYLVELDDGQKYWLDFKQIHFNY